MMKKSWETYSKESIKYLKYIPLGITLAIFFHLLNDQCWQNWYSFFICSAIGLIYGLVIVLTVWSFHFGVFLVFSFIQQKTNNPQNIPSQLFIAGVAVGSLFGIWLASYVKSYITGNTLRNITFMPFIIGSTIGLIIYLHILYQKAKEEALTLQAKVAEANYNTLKNQMQPHFLFNVLNNIAELIETDHLQASQVAYDLSELYRQILTNSKNKTASLESEISIVKKYLELEKVRYGKRLNFSINIPVNAQNIYLPSLILQTLVENAIKHGISKLVEGGNISIDVKELPNKIFELTIINPVSETSSVGTGTGLINTKERLSLLYGELNNFSIKKVETNKIVTSFCFLGEKIV